MNIALIHDWLTNVAGAERVLLAIKEIYPDAPIYTSVFEAKAAKPFSNYEIHTSYLQKNSLFRKRREILVPYTPLAFESFDLSKYDVVITNTTFPAKGIITKPETLHICYCHTPTRYLWESQIDQRASNGKLSGLRQKVAHKLRIWDLVASSRPDYYFANSKTVQARIKKYYRRDSEVIYPPVEIDRFKIAATEELKDYYLFVSRLVDYKKCDIVIQAFNTLGLPLKIVGSGPQKRQLRKMAKSNIEFLGFVSDQDIIKYYSEAKAFIFAAEEDFGIVPVEAMASGRPIIAYGEGGASETIIAGKTGEFFYEQTPKAIIEAVKQFDATKYDPVIIRQRAEEFSKSKFKTEFKSKIDEIIEDYQKNGQKIP